MRRTLLGALILLGTTTSAVADDESSSDTSFLGDGLLWFHLETQFGPGPGSPIAISPDISYWHGSMVYSVLHSSAAITGFSGLQSGSICIHDCDAFSGRYHGGALQVAYHTIDASSLFEVHAGLVLEDLDPAAFGIKLGGELWKYLGGDGFILQVKPNVLIGVNERDAFPGRFNLPIDIGFLTFVQLESGVTVPFDHAGDLWQVPISLKVMVPLGDKILANGAFTFPAAFAGDGVTTSGTDEYTATLGIELMPWINGL